MSDRSKALRSKLCIEDVCQFDDGCGCLEAIDDALVPLRAEIEQLKAAYEIQMRKTDAAEADNGRLRAALEPFAEVARWAHRNGVDLADYDMLLRGPGKEIAGNLQAQSSDFIRASEVLGDEGD